MSCEPIEHQACRERTPAEQAVLDKAEYDRAGRAAQAYSEIVERLAPLYGFTRVADAWRDASPQGRALLVAAFRELIPLIEQPLLQQLRDTTIDRDRWRRVVELLAQAANGNRGVEYVAQMAERLARVTALRDRWQTTPGRAKAALELESALDARDQ